MPSLDIFFSGCGVRVSECARPGGHCRARLCLRHTHRCPRLASPRVAHTLVAGWHLCPDARAPPPARSCPANPTEPEARSAPQSPALTLPATSWGPWQPRPCSVRAGVVWVLPYASLVPPDDLRSGGLGAKPPQAPPRVRFPGMTLSHRPWPRPRKEEAEGPAPGIVLPTHSPGCHQSHRIPALLPLGLSFPSRAMAGRGSGVSRLVFDGWEPKDFPRVKISSQSQGLQRGPRPKPPEGW